MTEPLIPSALLDLDKLEAHLPAPAGPCLKELRGFLFHEWTGPRPSLEECQAVKVQVDDHLRMLGAGVLSAQNFWVEYGQARGKGRNPQEALEDAMGMPPEAQVQPTAAETQDYVQWMTTGEDFTPAELLERVLVRVLKETKLPHGDREALEKAVFIARAIQKKGKP